MWIVGRFDLGRITREVGVAPKNKLPRPLDAGYDGLFGREPEVVLEPPSLIKPNRIQSQ